jgi:hypothetical protein
MKHKINYKLTLISIIVISILCIATVYAISEARKTVVIDPQSEYGKNLTGIAEKSIGNEGIDTKYIHLTTIYYETKDNIMVKFEGAKRYSNGVVYSHADFGEDETVTFFAADLGRYGVYCDKNFVCMDETYGQGKDYKYNIQGNSLELIDPATNKVMFVLSDYTVVRDENKVETIADEINSKYAYAQQPLPIDNGKPYIIMDVTMNDEDGWLSIDVDFYKEQLYSLHVEEGIKEVTKTGFYKTAVIHSVKY